MPSYTVLVDDNFHYQDEGERYQHGTFPTYEEAVAACRRIVDEFLATHHRPGQTEAELYAQYTSFGEDPLISPDDADARFSGWAYARERCAELCA
jgi:hypothetical protein